jgi:hypothetical protein
VNASEQRHDPDSLLHFLQLLIARYRSSPEIGWGRFDVIRHSGPGVLAHTLTGAEGRMLALHNFRGEPATVSLTLDGLEPGDRFVDLLVDGRILEPDDDGRLTVQLEGYGFSWLRVLPPGDRRLG